jgi:hypothetical protein
MTKVNSRAQAAVEFLTTYGWAFLIIIITIGALYYSGILDFGRYLPEECVFPSQFTCQDFTMDSAAPGTIKFKLANNIGEKVKITYANVTNDADPALSCTSLPIPNVDWDNGAEHEFSFSGCTGSDFLPQERIEALFTLRWYSENTVGNPQHTIKGKIMARVR